MEYDEDDLPADYPNVWDITAGHLWSWRQKGRGPKKNRAPRTVSQRWRDGEKRRTVKFFEELGPTDDWRENRRIYNRRKDRR